MNEDFTQKDEGIFAEQERLKKEAEEAKKQDELLDAEFAKIMRSAGGRKALRWVLNLAGTNESVTSVEPMRMAILSGRRDVGLALAQRLAKADAELFGMLMKEAE